MARHKVRNTSDSTKAYAAYRAIDYQGRIYGG